MMKRICNPDKLIIFFLALLFSFSCEEMIYAQCKICYPLKKNKNETYKIGDEWKVDYPTKDGTVTKVTKRVTIYRTIYRKNGAISYSTVSYGMLCPANSSRWHPTNRFCNCCSPKAFGFTSGSSSKTPDLQQPQQPVKETQKQQCAGHIWLPSEHSENDLKQRLDARKNHKYTIDQKRSKARKNFEKIKLDPSLEYGCVIFLYNNSVYLSSITPGNRDYEAAIKEGFIMQEEPIESFRSTRRVVNGKMGYYLYDSNGKWDKNKVKLNTPFEGFRDADRNPLLWKWEMAYFYLSGSWSIPDILECPELNSSIPIQEVVVLEVIHSHPEKLYISHERKAVDKSNVTIYDFTEEARKLDENIFSNQDLIAGMKNGYNVSLFNVVGIVNNNYKVVGCTVVRETTFDPSTMQYLSNSKMKSPASILKDGWRSSDTKKETLKCSECNLEIRIL